MNMKSRINIKDDSPNIRQEQGQSIVLIALILVSLLLFVGIAVDVGFIFARGSQLQAAVDSAALSGVSELIQAGDLFDTTPADVKAGQFLNANGIPITNTAGITITFDSSRALTELGVTEYSITVTWPVELFFLKLLRDEPVDLTRSATAGVSVLTDIYASRRVQDGTVTTSTQGIFGPQICTSVGDPFSPWNSTWEPETYTYRYRIMIPEDFWNSEDVVRVELFDPDTINTSDNFATIKRTSDAILAGEAPVKTESCGSATSGTPAVTALQRNPCVLPTGEEDLVSSGQATIDQVNLFWYHKIDENRGSGGGYGDGTCNTSADDPYVATYNAETKFELYYYRQTTDGQPVEVPIASYIGYMGDPSRDLHGDHGTDMRWVSPGADSQGNDYPLPDVPGVSEVPTTEGDTSFEVVLADINNIMVDASSGARYLWLDVTTLSGSSENGFEIWAGPDDYVATTSSDVNERNLAAINTPGSHDSNGVIIYALGRLPLNSIYEEPVDIPLLYIGPEQAGATLTVSLFDADAGVEPPVTFYFDTINEADWSKTFYHDTDPDPDGLGDTRCDLGGSPGCNNQWVEPAFNITVPGDLSSCDYQNPNQDDCTPFYGGRFMVNYNGGTYDSYGWQIQLSGLPYLIR